MILKSRACRWLLLIALVSSMNGNGFAAEVAPTLEELKKGHQELQEYSESVQGKFWIYRVEKILPNIFEEDPSVLAFDLKSEGYLWRSKQRFRADYKTFNMVKGKMEETENSLARDSKRIYEFSVSTPHLSVDYLSIYDLKAEEAKLAMSIDGRFIHHLDALWSSSGVPYTDFLKEPGSKLVLDRSNPAGVRLSMLVPTRDKISIDPEFEMSSPYPFKHLVTSPVKAMSFEKRVEYTEQNGIIVPSRITTVSSFGGGSGYSEVVIFELEPLAESSPINKDFDVTSFENSGKQCMVMYHKEPEPWIKRQYNFLHKQITRLTASAGSGNSYLLWLGVIAVSFLLIWFVFFRKNART